MNGELIWVLSLLVIAIILFATGKVCTDVVALLVIVAFILSGALTTPEIFSGPFGPNVVLIAASFIINDGLVRVGAAIVTGTQLVKMAGNSKIKMLVLLVLTVAGPGVLMGSTDVAAISIPAVLSVAMCMQMPPSRLMMPLSLAEPTSDMMILVATPPGLVVDNELLREGYHSLGLFSVTPTGLVVLVLGILYVLVTHFMLKRGIQAPQREGWTHRTFRDLIRKYRLAGCARYLVIRSGSPMTGQRLDDLRLRERCGANIIGVERWRRFRRVTVSVNGASEFRACDVLLINMSATDIDPWQFCGEQLLEPMVLRGECFSDQTLSVDMVEISLIPESELIGKSVRRTGFRARYGLNVVGLKRDGVALGDSLVDEPLPLGDIILVMGNWKLIGMLTKQDRDFVVLNLPEEVSETSPAHSQALHTILCLVLMMALMPTSEIPSSVAAIITCLLIRKLRCIDARSAYKSIHWPSIILTVGMMPFAVALQKMGGVALVVEGPMDIGGGYGPYMMLSCLFVLSAVIGSFISNTATVVLMALIALAAAKTMGTSPYPFAMVAAMVVSAIFMTPISSPANTLVLGPGNCSSSDFIKLGVPLTITVMVVCVVIVPMLFPF